MGKISLSLFSLAALFFFVHGAALHCVADVSFVVIDLKYNSEQGVKICEMQPGSFSRFSGVDALQRLNAIPHSYCDLLSKYDLQGYFTHPLYQNMKKTLLERGWSSVHSAQEIASYAPPPEDRDNLFDYSYCLFSLGVEPILRGDPERFPHVLFLDRAILPFCQSKYTMNCLFEKLEETKKLRPIWQIYRKGTSSFLIEHIKRAIPGDLVVIKPVQATMGRGVIIVEKKQLKNTLDYIFLSPKEVLLADMERSYSHYAVDKSDYFIVEEFIPSDPIFLGEPPLPYDCTMRVMAVLSYHEKKTSVTFLGAYWYSPHKPIDPAYTLIQSHKAKGTHYAEVSPEILEKVQETLFPALLKIYSHMLSSYN